MGDLKDSGRRFCIVLAFRLSNSAALWSSGDRTMSRMDLK